jgi:hypothetical protein
MTNCEEKKADLDNLTTDAKIVGFVTEKCYCCWGWVINVGSTTIKADSIPELSPSENTTFPISARITIGGKTRSCSEYRIDMDNLPDFYEIKSFTIIK